MFSSLRIHNGHISYELGKQTVWPRATAEPTQEPRVKNDGTILFYLILLHVSQLLDKFERVERKERK